MAARLQAGLSPAAVDPVVQRMAWEFHALLVVRTPKKWTGNLRQAWQTRKIKDGVYVVSNASPVMSYIERGTANGGTGYIYPRTAKALYIPLNRRASFGWKKGFKHGRDYLLVRRVRGIKPRWIIRTTSAEMQPKFVEMAKAHIRSVLAGGGK